MPKLTFHGHACFELEHGGKRLVIDPFLTGNPKADIGPAQLGVLAGVALDRFAYPLEAEHAMLVATTEKRTAEDVDTLIDVLKQI